MDLSEKRVFYKQIHGASGVPRFYITQFVAQLLAEIPRFRARFPHRFVTDELASDEGQKIEIDS